MSNKRFLQNEWQHSGDFCQYLWAKLLNYLGADEFQLYVYGNAILMLTAYWGVASICHLVDMRPKWFGKWKIQPGTNDPLDYGRLIGAVSVVLFNQICVGFPTAMLCFEIFNWRTNADNIATLPTFQRFFFEFVAGAFLVEIFYFYLHRLLHHRLIYKHIHKIHHEWKSPIAITALYVHPVEFFLSFLALEIPHLILNTHVLLQWIVNTLAMILFCLEHCGYHFPGTSFPRFHDFHHESFCECFGALGILDYLHGTDIAYRQRYTKNKLSTR